MTDRSGAAAREVLLANQAFYRAFSGRDVAGMEALWATSAAVACIHPGWTALRGRELVLASWRSILGSEVSPNVTCDNASAHVFGEAAFVICEELVGGARLIATNVFVKEGGAWKMAHHQAAPVAPDTLEIVRAPEDTDEDVDDGDRGGGALN